MAMTLRLPEDINVALEKVSAARHTSKHALIVQAVEEFTKMQLDLLELRSDFERIRQDEAKVLRRLEDA